MHKLLSRLRIQKDNVASKVRPGREGRLLEILLPPRRANDKATSIQWCLRRHGGIEASGKSDNLADISAQAKEAPAIIWSPPSETLLTNVSLPSRNRGKIQQALPFALEEQLISEPEQQFIAYITGTEGLLDVAVTERKHIQQWVSEFNDNGINAQALCPANLALPHTSDSWSLYFYKGECWLRSGTHSGLVFAGEGITIPAALTTILTDARKQDKAPTTLLVFNVPVNFDNRSWAEALGLNVVSESTSFWESSNGEGNTPFNLLQGEFAPRRELNTNVSQFRFAAILLAIWFTGTLAFDTWEWIQLSREHQQTRMAMTQLFRSTFPDAKAIVDPVLQMQRKLDEFKGGSGGPGNKDMLTLLAKSAMALSATSSVQLTAIKYNDSALTAEINLPDFQTLESLKNRLASTGLTIEVLSANSQDDKVSGRLRIHGGRE
ncbi:MAG: GspL family type II secretion system protein XcpY [Gammaproteobacteria bacterium]|nr:MAG: GspL family type II secretion system protein XcpY [Gammaproteobacteria bacterium]